MINKKKATASESVQFFCYRLFINVLSLEIQLSRRDSVVPLADLILPHFCAYPKPESGFQTSHEVGFFMFTEWR